MPTQYTLPVQAQLPLPGILDRARQCYNCKNVLPHTLEFFYAHKKGPFGLMSLCKKCHLNQCRERYTKNREHYNARTRAYYEKNKDHLLSIQKSRYHGDDEYRAQFLKDCSEYRSKNIDHINLKKAEYRNNNRELLRQRDKQWRESEAGQAARAAYKSRPDVVAKRRERHREYYPQWLSAVPGRRAAYTMGVLMGRALRGQKAGCRWESVVGYTLDDLMQHLEARFKPGMTWENYGRQGWHIDHIIPRSAFSFETAADPAFRECWALSNLQPLWEAENLSKKDKIL